MKKDCRQDLLKLTWEYAYPYGSSRYDGNKELAKSLIDEFNEKIDAIMLKHGYKPKKV